MVSPVAFFTGSIHLARLYVVYTLSVYKSVDSFDESDESDESEDAGDDTKVPLVEDEWDVGESLTAPGNGTASVVWLAIGRGDG